MRYFLLVALAPALYSAELKLNLTDFSDRSGWSIWSHRAETAPKSWVDTRVALSPGGSLALSGNSNSAAHGGWERSVKGVEPGRWYRFAAHYKSQAVQFPTWQILARVEWRNASGKRAGQPDYIYRSEASPSGWTKITADIPAPENASEAVIQLYLSHSPSGTVWWDDISLTSIANPGKRNVRVATIYLRPENTKSREASVERFIETATSAAAGKLDVLLFPEGMTVIGTGKSYADVAETVPGPTTERLGRYARERKTWIVAGLYEREAQAIYNTAVLIDRDGNLAGKYRKVYLPREEYERGIAPGHDFPVFDTDFGRIGLMICYDVFFNAPAQALAGKGAEIILLPIWGGDETLAKARAIEHRIFLVTSGYDHPTYIMDPNGERLSLAANKGQAAIAEIDLNARYLERHLGDMKARRAKEQRTDLWPVERP